MDILHIDVLSIILFQNLNFILKNLIGIGTLSETFLNHDQRNFVYRRFVQLI